MTRISRAQGVASTSKPVSSRFASRFTSRLSLWSSSSLVVGSLFFATVPTLWATDVAALTVQQQENPFDRHFERLPDVRLIRGAKLKNIPLRLDDVDANTAWSIRVDQPWLTVSPGSGVGPATVELQFITGALASFDDAAAAITIETTGDNPVTAVQNVSVNIWPKIFASDDRASMRSFLKKPANWPNDGGFGGAWELWGFLPDDESHPGRGAGRNMDAWEKTPCSAGQSGADCTREGQAGLAAGQSADAAWLLSSGDPRVVVAVLDSGIFWDSGDLVNKAYLNAEELRSCAPAGADPLAPDAFAAFDVNGDGVFNIRDYDFSPFITDVNLNGRRDAQDLIYGVSADGSPCSDGTDDDNDGYVDNISGWDFLWNDNDASDDTDFGHGTGEANDSVGEANNDEGGIGLCPRCLFMPLRVGDSFVTDVNHFGHAVVFAVDTGASVVQEALGTLNNTPYMQAAIDYAYKNNVPIIASAADERSYHHNYPGNGEHTLYVHSITGDTDGNFTDAATFLNFTNCTNFGGHLTMSTPGASCSSEAVGKTSGQAGLIASYYLQLQDAARDDGINDAKDTYYQNPLTAEEMYQVIIASAEDIDVPGMENDADALANRRYPSNEGWDLHFGYGRNNSRVSLELLRDQKIPPEVNVSSPKWFEVIDPARQESIDVVAQISSSRLENLRWRVFVGAGITPKTMTEINSGTGAIDGVVGQIDLSSSGPLADLVNNAAAKAGSDPEQFTVTVEIFALGTGPNGDVQGRFKKNFSLRRDDTMLTNFPIFVGASGESSPKLSDINGDGRDDVVLLTADGRLHAFQSDGAELAGFPVHLNTLTGLGDAECANPNSPKCYKRSRAFAEGHIDTSDIFASAMSTVAVGDLDGDGSVGKDLVAASIDGLVFAFDSSGNVLPGFPVGADPTFMQEFTDGALRCSKNGAEAIGCRTEQRFGEIGFFAAPVLVDLDKDGTLEIVAGGLDQHAYAWHHDGTPVAGWPVHLFNRAVPAFDESGSPLRYDDRIVSSPAVANLLGDGTPFIVMGTNERVENSADSFLYAIWPDGNLHEGGPFPTGWPTAVAGFIPDEILPFVGRGHPNSPAVADVDHDGDDEVICNGLGSQMFIMNGDGSIVFAMESTSSFYGENHDVDEPLGSLPVINNPSVADLDGDGRLDIINGTAGLGLIQIASNGGLRAEFDHSISAWIADNGFFQAGFPKRVWDYQFFMNYVVADLDGDGKHDTLSGDGGFFVYSANANGDDAVGFPKFTNQWHAATPAVGDIDGDGKIDVVANTREGWLYAWRNTGDVAAVNDKGLPAIQWASFHHDDANTGNLSTPLPVREPKPIDEEVPPTGCTCDMQGRGDMGGSLMSLAFLGMLATFSAPAASRMRRRANRDSPAV